MEFIDRLTVIAAETGAEFIEVALRPPRAEAIDNPIGETYDSLQRLLEHRPEAMQIDVVRDDVDRNLQDLVDALRRAGATW